MHDQLETLFAAHGGLAEMVRMLSMPRPRIQGIAQHSGQRPSSVSGEKRTTRYVVGHQAAAARDELQGKLALPTPLSP